MTGETRFLKISGGGSNLTLPKTACRPQVLQFSGRIAVMWGAVLLASCSTPGTGSVSGNARFPALAQLPAVDGQWSSMVQFLDRTFLYPETHERPRPQEGWWVTGIRAHLLGDGNVLISGWSRAKAQFCEDHLGRQNGTSFVLNDSRNFDPRPDVQGHRAEFGCRPSSNSS